MTIYTAVDLAARYSAMVSMQDGEVIAESVVDFGPANAERPGEVLARVAVWSEEVWGWGRAAADSGRFICEDVSHFMVNPKPAIRTQGAFLVTLAGRGLYPELVMSNVWQRELGYRKQKGRSSKGWAKERVAGLGYVPSEGAKGGVDLRDAYLMCRWAAGDVPREDV